jgi:hypothetical protein
MSLNALVTWNISAQTATSRRNDRIPLKRHEFLWYNAESMLNFKDTRQSTAAMMMTSTAKTVVTRDTDLTNDGRSPVVPCTDHNAKCAVCRLDWNIEKLARIGRPDWGNKSKSELRVVSK